MATTTKEYTGNGSNYINGATTAQCDFTFPYLKQTDVKVSLNGTTLETTKYTFPSSTSIQFTSGTETTTQEANGAPKTGVTILIYRDTDVDSAKAVYASGSSIRAFDLNNNKDQSLFFEQEVGDPTNPKNFVTSAQISDGTSLSAADKTKLDTIEANAKDDQTGAEIKTLYEAESNTNAFTDAEKTKLGTVQANAKDDQTAAEIKSLYESNSQTNAFTDAEKTKLGTVEANAKDDQTATEIKSLYESNSDTNAFTDNDHTKLDGIESNAINASNTAITNKLPLAGGTLTGNITVSNTHPKLFLTDTDNNSDYSIENHNGNFVIKDTTNDTNRLRLLSNGTIEAKGTLEAQAGLDVTGDLTVSGNMTVSGTNTTIDTTTLNVEDKNIELGKVSTPTDTTADGGGITLKGATDKTFQWLDATDSWTSSEHIALPDNKKLQLGASQDLILRHNGVHSFVHTETGNLSLSSVQKVQLSKADQEGSGNYENMVQAIVNGSVELYFDNSKKLETRSGGVTVSGTINAAGGTFSNNLRFASNVGTLFGGSDELQVFHSSGTSYISHNGSGQLQLRAKASEQGIKIFPDAGVELYYDGNKKFQTTSTGNLFLGSIKGADNADLILGNSDDFQLFHDGTYSRINATSSPIIVRTGMFHINNGANNASLFKATDGAGIELYYNNSKKFETLTNGAKTTGNFYVTAANNTDAIIALYADNSDDHDDMWIMKSTASGSNFLIQNYAGGAWETSIKGVGNAQTELYYNNSKKLETTSTGIKSEGIDHTFGSGNDNPAAGSRQRIAILGDTTNGSMLHIRGGSPAIYFDQSGSNTPKIYQDNTNLAFHAGTPISEGINTLLFKTNGGINMPNDNAKLQIGASQDLQLYHDGTDNYFLTNTGTTYIRHSPNGGDIKINATNIHLTNHVNNETHLKTSTNGAVDLYYDNSKKLETTSTGVKITGSSAGDGLTLFQSSDLYNRVIGDANRTLGDKFLLSLAGRWSGGQIVADVNIETGDDTTNKDDGRISFRTSSSNGSLIERLRIEPSGHIKIPADNKKIIFGADEELSITHTGSNSDIVHTGTGRLRCLGNYITIANAAGNEDFIKTSLNSSVRLYYDDSEKLATTATGATVTTTSAANSIKNITTSTSGPSGGSDGDLWFTYVA